MHVPPLNSSSGSILAESFACSWSSGANASWVHLAGELDLAGAPLLESTLDEAQKNTSLVVLDPRELTFIDCAGIHTILHSATRARREGGWLMLMVASPVVERMLALTGRQDLVTIFDLDLEFLPPLPGERTSQGRHWRGGSPRSTAPKSSPGSHNPQRHRGLRAVRTDTEKVPSPTIVRTPAWSRSTPERDHATKPLPAG